MASKAKATSRHKPRTGRRPPRRLQPKKPARRYR